MAKMEIIYRESVYPTFFSLNYQGLEQKTGFPTPATHKS